MVTQMSSREFNHDTSGAKKAARKGPVYITDRGRPAHVLLTYEAYEHLLDTRRVLELLGEPSGVAEVELDTRSSDELPRPATFT